MSYNLQFTDQSVDPIAKAPIVVPVGTTNTTSTPLALTGKGAANYGGLQQQNLLHLLENFADSVEPANPTVGQLWYDATAKIIKVLIATSPSATWKSLGGVQVTATGGTPPASPALGDLWYESTGSGSGFMYVYTGLGRYPTSPTAIGGWDQVHPAPETYAGRAEYDRVRELLSRLIGNAVSTYGSGAIGRSITNLTDFAALDNDFRAKYKALLPLDSNVLYSPASGVDQDREITKQAENTTFFYFNDSATPADGYLSGPVADPAIAQTAGTISIGGIATALPGGLLRHQGLLADAFIMYDQLNILSPAVVPDPGAYGPYFVVRQGAGATWEYDTGTTWASFTPAAQQYIIGTITTPIAENNSIYPNDSAAFVWASAVPIVGTKIEHLLVEPNSNDWDTLLAAAKYSLNRLELPIGYERFISDLPFVSDGRKVDSSLIGLDSASDVRYPSAARRASRKISAVGASQGFSETVNALNTAVSQRFSLKGINGATGTNTAFAATTSITPWCVVPKTMPSSGFHTCGVSFKFASMDELNRFLGSGGGIQISTTHPDGSTQADNEFRLLLASVGTVRLTADKSRVFGQSLPLTLTRPTANVGLWNAVPFATQLLSLTQSGSSVTQTFNVYRTSNTELRIYVSYSTDSGTNFDGTTSISFSVISDNETFLPGPVDVYPKPIAFTSGDIVDTL